MKNSHDMTVDWLETRIRALQGEVARLEADLEKAREALSSVLAIIDSPEQKAEASVAWIHGVQCDPEISKRNGATIEAAYRLLGRERPL
jgi:hypothetical protein